MEQVSYYLLDEISIYPLAFVKPICHSSRVSYFFCSYRSLRLWDLPSPMMADYGKVNHWTQLTHSQRQMQACSNTHVHQEHTLTQERARTDIHIQRNSGTHTLKHTHKNTYTRTLILYTQACTCTQACIHTKTHAHTEKHICSLTHTHTHTHTHTNTDTHAHTHPNTY